MKRVVWGTGKRAKKLVSDLGIENIDFFIDINKEKNNFYLKQVYHPEQVDDWHDLYIYVPSTYFHEVQPILEKHGLREKIDYRKHEKMDDYTYSDLMLNYNHVIKYASRLAAIEGKGKICNWGSFWKVNNKFSDFYLQLLKQHRHDFVVVCEWVFENTEKITEELGMPAIVVPFLGYGIFNINQMPKQGQIRLMRYIENCPDKEMILELSDGYMLRKPSISREAALCNAYFLYKFMLHMLNTFKFRMVINNGSDAPERMLLKKICQNKGILCLSTHPSVLPGTISFDPGGDMGSSMPAVYYRAFRQLSVEISEVEAAKKICHYLRKSQLNRHEQPKNETIEAVKKNISEERPVVLCVGQCDDGACLMPYTEESRRYHSPMFASSVESAVFLAGLCKKNKWNLIYKSHPMYAKFDRVDLLPDNIIYVDNCDINDLIDMSDVVVTIRSSTNYVALVRERPVLMLGYTQTHGQGCTYEAFEKNAIEPQLKQAVDKGFTAEQKEAFTEHVARLLKYYLYDDTLPRELRYGLPMPEKFEDFFELGRKLQKMNEAMKAGAANV